MPDLEVVDPKDGRTYTVEWLTGDAPTASDVDAIIAEGRKRRAPKEVQHARKVQQKAANPLLGAFAKPKPETPYKPKDSIEALFGPPQPQVGDRPEVSKRHQAWQKTERVKQVPSRESVEEWNARRSVENAPWDPFGHESGYRANDRMSGPATMPSAMGHGRAARIGLTGVSKGAGDAIYGLMQTAANVGSKVSGAKTRKVFKADPVYAEMLGEAALGGGPSILKGISPHATDEERNVAILNLLMYAGVPLVPKAAGAVGKALKDLRLSGKLDDAALADVLSKAHPGVGDARLQGRYASESVSRALKVLEGLDDSLVGVGGKPELLVPKDVPKARPTKTPKKAAKPASVEPEPVQQGGSATAAKEPWEMTMDEPDPGPWPQAHRGRLESDESWAQRKKDLARRQREWKKKSVARTEYRITHGSYDAPVSAGSTPGSGTAPKPGTGTSKADALLEASKPVSGGMGSKQTGASSGDVAGFDRRPRGDNPRLESELPKIARKWGVVAADYRMGPTSTAAGFYRPPNKRFPGGRVTAMSMQGRSEVVSHEVAHAIDAVVAGGPRRSPKGDLDLLLGPGGKRFKQELANVTRELVGDTEFFSKHPRYGHSYYMKGEELWARFLESVAFHPDIVKAKAPGAYAALRSMGAKHPPIADFLKVVDGGSLDAKTGPMFLPDRRQQFLKDFGTYLGEEAYSNDLSYRRLKVRMVEDVQKEMESLFGKGGDQRTMFRAAEGIERFDANGNPVFVADTALAKSGEDAWNALAQEDKARVAKYAEMRPIWKAQFKIKSDIEGYVHHFWDERPLVGSAKKIKEYVAASRLKRTGSVGYVEDLKRATTKMVYENRLKQIHDEHMARQMALLMEPVKPDTAPKPGFVRVEGDFKQGFEAKGQRIRLMLKDGKKFKIASGEFDLPKWVWDEMTTHPLQTDTPTMKAMNELAKYQSSNLMLHPGTWGVNIVGGAAQLGMKLVQDFHADLLSPTGMRTIRNIEGLFKTMTPKGWKDAPDWVYGGSKGTWAGQLLDANPVTKANPMDWFMKGYGKIEEAFKKAIVNMEEAKNRHAPLDSREVLYEINKVVDQIAYDYENVPIWMKKSLHSPVGRVIKPFATFPYKYGKMLTGYAGAIFDPRLPAIERVTKATALATMVMLVEMVRNGRAKYVKYDQKTGGVVEVPPNEAERVVYQFGDKGIDPTKFQFFNAVELFHALAGGRGEQARDVALQTTGAGSVSPLADAILAAAGYSDKYDKYKDLPTKLGESVGTLLPLARVGRDVAEAHESKRRRPKGFVEAVFERNYLPPMWRTLAGEVGRDDPGIRDKAIGRLLGLGSPEPIGKPATKNDDFSKALEALLK